MGLGPHTPHRNAALTLLLSPPTPLSPQVDPEKRIVAIRLTTTTNGPLPAQLAAEAAAAAPAAAIAADSDDAAAF